MMDAGSIEAVGLRDCKWLLALVRLPVWASEFCGAGLWDSPSGSGAAFLLVGVSAPCPVGLPVPVRWRWWLRPAAQRGGPGGYCIAFGGGGGGGGGIGGGL